MAAKKKPAPAAEPAPAPEKVFTVEPGPLVDELGEIAKRLAPFRADIAREGVLKSTVRGLTDDQTSHVHGEKFLVVLGPRENKTIVAYYDLARRIGLDAYAQIATATLEALGKVVKPGILAGFLRTEPIGTRPLMVVAKEAK